MYWCVLFLVGTSLLFKGPAVMIAIGCELRTLWVCMLLSFKAVLMVLPHVQLYYGVFLYLLRVPFYAVSY